MTFRSKLDAEYNIVCPKLTNAPTILSLSTTTARTAALATGSYYLWSIDTDCYVLQGGSTITAVAATSIGVALGMRLPFTVTSAADAYIAGITSSGTGNLYIVKI